MKYLWQWVNEHLPAELQSPTPSTTLLSRLTMAGLEVESCTSLAPELNAMAHLVVVAEIRSVAQHPNADKLKICQVFDGEKQLNIVCGASNARAGLKVALAKIGATLPPTVKFPDGITIKKAQLRGVESEGMLCSLEELGLKNQVALPSIDGIAELPEQLTTGESLVKALYLNDVLLELKITPNRGDCLSILGLAREIIALAVARGECTKDAAVALPKINSANQLAAIHAKQPQNYQVTLQANQACPSYCAVELSVRQNSHQQAGGNFFQITQRLLLMGMRPISPVVDITNYVLLATGQPLHAFDASTIAKKHIIVRHGKPNEWLVLLNQKEVALSEKHLLIADDQKALALAGVMGGDSSAVGDHTTTIVLEGAFFAPEVVAHSTQTTMIDSDAGYRFERGVDPLIHRQYALSLAVQLLATHCQANPTGWGAASALEHLPTTKKLTIPLNCGSQDKPSDFEKLIGFALPIDTQMAILTALGCQCTLDGNALQITPPAWRFDLQITQDLVEEIIRCYGYDNLPNQPTVASLQGMTGNQPWRKLMGLRRLLAGKGLREIISYSFVDQQWDEALSWQSTPAVVLKNPIAANMNTMRRSLLPGLLLAWQHNSLQQANDLALFEIGTTFIKGHTKDIIAEQLQLSPPLPQQPNRLGILVAGKQNSAHWQNTTEGNVSASHMWDYYNLKGVLENVLQSTLPESVQRSLTWQAIAAHSKAVNTFHPKRSAIGFIGEQPLVTLGEIHPSALKSVAIDTLDGLYYLEMDIDLWRSLQTQKTHYQPFSRLHSVQRDLALVLSEKISWGALQALLNNFYAQTPCPSCQNWSADIFDMYQNDDLKQRQQKSYAVRIQLTPSNQLTDEIIDEWIGRLLAHLNQQQIYLRQ